MYFVQIVILFRYKVNFFFTGGNLGLFTGLSLLSICELFYWLARIGDIWRKSLKNKTKIDTDLDKKEETVYVKKRCHYEKEETGYVKKCCHYETS